MNDDVSYKQLTSTVFFTKHPGFRAVSYDVTCFFRDIAAVLLVFCVRDGLSQFSIAIQSVSPSPL